MSLNFRNRAELPLSIFLGVSVLDANSESQSGNVQQPMSRASNIEMICEFLANHKIKEGDPTSIPPLSKEIVVRILVRSVGVGQSSWAHNHCSADDCFLHAHLGIWPLYLCIMGISCKVEEDDSKDVLGS